MQHHFVVVYDEITQQWSVDIGTTDARFRGENVYDFDKDSGDWEDWNDNTSEALNQLIHIFEEENK